MISTSLSAPSDIRMESHTQSIDDLPNELVYLILGNLDLEDLIPLGCVSRRFNILAFTFYFSLVHGLHHFITNGRSPFSSHYMFDHTPYPAGTLLAGRTQRHPFCTLSALRLAILVRQPVASVSASFTTARFVEEADQLQKYLRTGPELIGMRLTLSTLGMQYFAAPLLDGAKEEHYRAVCRVLEGLQTIIPRASGFTWTVGGDIAIPVDAAPFTAAPLTNLHSVSLRECSVLFSPPLKDWTIASLHQSRVHSLEIDGSILAPYHQSIQLAHLVNLKILAYGTMAARFSLGTFLSRHPSLEKVSFRSDLSPAESGAAGSNYQLEDNALPNVTELSAPIEYLILWLSNASALSSMSAVNANSCLALTPAFANAFSPEQLSAAYGLTRELLTLMSQRPTISTFLFPLCELRGGDIFPPLDISHVRVLHCTPVYQFEMTDEAAEEIIATLVGFTGAETLVVNQNRSRHGGWNANLVPKLRELCPGICLQLH
ncbi:hypothetical protein BDZ89DRAFT_1081830 [Hymenopellis radicata]|nr:hypothetical protein BDZ89DRAFT_1081830 [Hymenopellis radicata]